MLIYGPRPNISMKRAFYRVLQSKVLSTKEVKAGYKKKKKTMDHLQAKRYKFGKNRRIRSSLRVLTG